MTGFRAALGDILTEWASAMAVLLLRRRYPDWATALQGECESIRDHPGRLAWAVGSLRASIAIAMPEPPYPVVLGLCIGAMGLYQWSADESLTTVAVLVALAFGAGVLRPRWFVLSAMALGAVVATVNSFESLSGIRPAYEHHAHSLSHCLRWLVLVGPALLSGAVGREIGLNRPIC